MIMTMPTWAEEELEQLHAQLYSHVDLERFSTLYHVYGNFYTDDSFAALLSLQLVVIILFWLLMLTGGIPRFTLSVPTLSDASTDLQHMHDSLDSVDDANEVGLMKQVECQGQQMPFHHIHPGLQHLHVYNCVYWYCVHSTSASSS
jgi:hypothetical protein